MIKAKQFITIILVGVCVFSFESCSKKRCKDGKLNQDEVEVDCGGKCDPCPTCRDGILNQDEIRIDCGGPHCEECDPEWNKMESGTSENLNDLSFSGNVGVAVGDKGTILKTSDAGETWVKLASPVSVDLNAVQVLDENHFYIVGNEDNVLFSRDGLSFTVSRTNEKSDWKDLHFIHPDSGVVGGHPTRLCHTTDGGKTWQTKFEFPASKTGIDAISFLDNKIGYAIGGFTLYETLDGGLFWSDRHVGDNQTNFTDFGDLHYMATNRAFLTKKEGFYFSINSLEWTNKVLRCSKGKIDFKDEIGIYAGANSSGNRGKAMMSTDSGVKWTEFKDVPTDHIFTDGAVINSTVLILVGRSGVIFKRK